MWSVPELIMNVSFWLDPCWFISTTVSEPRFVQHHFAVLFRGTKSLSCSMRSAELSPTCLWFLHDVAFAWQCRVSLDTGECTGLFEIEATNGICQGCPLTTCPRSGFTEEVQPDTWSAAYWSGNYTISLEHYPPMHESLCSIGLQLIYHRFILFCNANILFFSSRERTLRIFAHSVVAIVWIASVYLVICSCGFQKNCNLCSTGTTLFG